MKYLYAAYFATWLIHLGYLGILARGLARVDRESGEDGGAGDSLQR